MSSFERSKMIDMLRRVRYCRVNFLKADGTTREMRATLNLTSMPLPELRNNPKTVSYSEDIVKVWDIDKGAWRSYRVDSVISFEAIQ